MALKSNPIISFSGDGIQKEMIGLFQVILL